MNQGFQAAIKRHAGQVSPTLDFSVPIALLADDLHCSTLTEDLSSVAPEGWGVLNATTSAWKAIPNKAGLYMFVWRPNLRFRMAAGHSVSLALVIYVGKAGGPGIQNTLKNRYRSEYSKYIAGDPNVLWRKSPALTRADRLQRFLTLTPLEYWYTIVDDTEEILGLERRLLDTLTPPLNDLRGPRLRPAKKSVKAF